MHKVLSTCFSAIWLSVITVYGQVNVTLYYNDKLELTTKENASSRREAMMDITQMIFDGDYKDYDKDEKLIGEGSYAKGERIGIHKVYKNDSLESAIEYLNGEFAIHDLFDEHGNKVVSDGTGKFSILYSYGKSFGTLTGEFRDGKRVGKWSYKQPQEKYREIYNDGLLAKGTAHEIYGERLYVIPLRVVISFRSAEIEKFNYDQATFRLLYEFFERYPLLNMDTVQRGITYAGGLRQLSNEIFSNLKVVREIFTRKSPGMVVITLKVNEHGDILEKKVVKSLNQKTDEEALRIISLSQFKFCPALLNGKPFQSYFSVPITFTIRE
jgi:TonB family protein